MKNNWFSAVRDHKTYSHVFSDWEKELQKPDVNTICQKEFNSLRK
jgi:hypothetical protein